MRKEKINTFLKLLIILLFICMVFILRKFINNEQKKEILYSEVLNTVNITEEEIPKLPEDININMVAVGDIMCHNTQYFDAYSEGIYDFSYVFEDIKEKMQTADITVGNLETTFAGSQRGYSSYPTFNTPEALATDLKETGIDLLSTANNHSLDKGYTGLESTLNYLDKEEIVHTGTYTSSEAQNTTTIVDVKGIKMAFLSFTYGTNGIPVPKDKEYCINLIDKELIVQQLDLAKQQNPDVICVFMHWGVEYQKAPNEEQNELANLLFENGVNIILGSHPHVLQKMEKRAENKFVIYSLGNFISGQVKENTRNSIVLNLSITKKGTGEIVIDSAEYTPIYMYKSAIGKVNRYKVLDIKKSLDAFNNNDENITQSEYEMLEREYNKIVNTVGNEF